MQSQSFKNVHKIIISVINKNNDNEKGKFIFCRSFLPVAIIQCGRTNQNRCGLFADKWNVLVKGTPNGDSKMVILLDKKDTTLAGVVQDTTGKEIAKIDKVDLSGDKATIYFNTQGYDVNLEMTKKDDDHFTGSMMGMFDAEGDRVKTTK